jgi:hypothetical protein
MDSKRFCEYIYDSCWKDGKFTLRKHEFESVFSGDIVTALKTLNEFCESKGLLLTVDNKDNTFTFAFPEPDLS